MKMILPVKSFVWPLKSRWSALVFLMLGLWFSNPVSAQFSIATGLPASASSGASTSPSVMMFTVENTNSFGVTLTGIDNYMGSTVSGQNWELRYTATQLSGTANASTWNLIATTTGPTLTTTGIFPLFSGLSFVIPGNTTYRFGLIVTASQIQYGPAGTTPNNITVNGVKMGRGDYMIGTGYVGYAGGVASPPFHPRFWAGTLYFAPTCTGTPAPVSITSAPMTAPVCNGTPVTISASTTTGAPTGQGYQWQQSSSATGPWVNVTGGTGGNTLNYTTATTLTTNMWFRVRSLCGTGSDSSGAYQVLVQTAPQVGAITLSGTPPVCAGTSRTFTVAAPTNSTATSYNWTLPSGWTGSSTTNSITANVSGNGTISVSATGACGTGPSQSLAVNALSTPAQPGPITGTSVFCAGTLQTYNVTPVANATSYIWTTPTGWTGTSNTSTLSATTNSNGGVVTVAASNACGTSAASVLGVTLTTQPATFTAISGNSSVCGGTTQTYLVTPPPGVLTYTWTLPSGWTGSSTGNSIIATAPSTAIVSTGNITVSASNGCGAPGTASLPVTVNPVVAVAASITPSTLVTSVCPNVPVTFTVTTTGAGSAPTYTWTRNSSTQTGVTGPAYTVNDLNNGDVIGLTITSNALCANPATVSAPSLTMTLLPATTPGININSQYSQAPVVCASTQLDFVANIVGGGSAPQYRWYRNNNLVAGNTPTYSATGWNNGDVVRAELTSNAQCAIPLSAQSNSIVVTVVPTMAPSTSITANPSNVYSPGVPITFTASSTVAGAAPLYQWYRNSQAIIGGFGPTYTTTTLTGGDTIWVRLTSSDECAFPKVVFSNKVVVELSTSVASTAIGGASVNLYPSPNDGRFTLSVASGVAGLRTSIEVLNAVGQRVYFRELVTEKKDWTLPVELSNVATGMYMLRLQDENGGSSLMRFEVTE